MNNLDLKKDIQIIEELVFKYDFNEVVLRTVKIVEYINNKVVFDGDETKNNWLNIIQYLMTGIENKDYLVISDILKFELLPFLKQEKIL